ncbi:MAG: Mov34/MPN/PAD-1 family protein [Candidatus Diapherotrites archaeon]|nr:Mov34/MPN/PAD-1 family protein [Candidatus Diapherotrites archaeon]
MWRIKKTLLEDACLSAQNYYPKEFACLIGGDAKNKTVKEIIFIPSETSENSVSFLESSLPFDETIIGSLHSHPNASYRPSTQDTHFFRKYLINIILGYPYNPLNTGFYDENGKRIINVLIE